MGVDAAAMPWLQADGRHYEALLQAADQVYGIDVTAGWHCLQKCSR